MTSTNESSPPVVLGALNSGDTARISHVNGGRMMVQRLAMLGIRPGVVISVLHGPGRRGAVIRIGGSRVALGFDVIDQIVVVPPTRGAVLEAAAE